MLNTEALHWINDYHLKVFEKISGSLTLEEKNWLQKVTKPL
jgi:Xaa-Pro aminopeptidase